MKLKIMACAVVLCATRLAKTAPEAHYTFDDLLNQKLILRLETPLPNAQKVKVSLGTACTVDVDAAKHASVIELTPQNTGECSTVLWKSSKLLAVAADTPGGAVVLQPPSIAPEPARSVAVDGTVAGSEALPDNARLILFTDPTKAKPWVTLPVARGKFDVPSILGERAGQGENTEYYLDTGSVVSKGKLTKPGAPASNPVTGNSPTGNSHMDCAKDDATRDAIVVCVDFLSPERFPLITFAGTRRKTHVIRPNKDVIVKVRHAAAARVTIQMAGTRGLFSPGTRNLSNAEMVSHSTGDGKTTAIQAVITVQEFAPRAPGDADITIRVVEEGKPEISYPIELIVEQTYSGAVRVGLGFPFGGAQDAKYGVVTRSGSAQSEIAAEEFGVADLELVVGYSAYLDRGGRSLVRGCYPLCFGPFFGIGVYAPEAQGVQFIKSAYLGAEVELSPNFSASINLVARRVTRLQEGYQVGFAVDGSDAPVRDGVGFGGGVVLTFSPDFLRLARPAAASFLE